MSTHTQQTKKRRPHLFICILILLIALACIFVQRLAGTDIYNKTSLPSIDFGKTHQHNAGSHSSGKGKEM